MIDYESMTNEELNELAALRCGWTAEHQEELQWIADHGELDYLTPYYTTSLDYCFAYFIPILHQKIGNYVEVRLCFELSVCRCVIEGREGKWESTDPNPARVFTIVFLKVEEQLANMKG